MQRVTGRPEQMVWGPAGLMVTLGAGFTNTVSGADGADLQPCRFVIARYMAVVAGEAYTWTEVSVSDTGVDKPAFLYRPVTFSQFTLEGSLNPKRMFGRRAYPPPLAPDGEQVVTVQLLSSYTVYADW
jgi:hypothetical protein